MKLIVRYFFLADILFLVDLNKYIFPWQTYFFGGSHLRLELSCGQVNMVLSLALMQIMKVVKKKL